MRNTILRILALLLITVGYAQQQGFSYKALISDNGSIVPNQAVVVQFTILEDGTTTVYQEEHVSTTDSNGILIVTIGEGTPTSGTFNNVDWTQEQFLKVVIDTGNGLTNFGTTAFKAVPYAKYAGKSDFNNLENVPDDILDGDNQLLTLSGGQLSITNGNAVTLPEGVTYTAGTGISISGGVITNTGDISTTNEIQNLTLNGSQLSITNGNAVTLPEGTSYSAGTGISITGGVITNTGDLSTTNEIQTLSTSGNTVSLSNGGGTINLPTSGKILSFSFNQGYGVSPDGGTEWIFIAPTANVTISESGQQILIMVTRALGAGTDPATGLDLSIGYQESSATTPANYAGSGMWGLQVPPNTRIPMSINTILSDLPVGTYQVGLVARGGTNWTNNEWSHTTAILFTPTQ